MAEGSEASTEALRQRFPELSSQRDNLLAIHQAGRPVRFTVTQKRRAKISLLAATCKGFTEIAHVTLFRNLSPGMCSCALPTRQQKLTLSIKLKGLSHRNQDKTRLLTEEIMRSDSEWKALKLEWIKIR